MYYWLCSGVVTLTCLIGCFVMKKIQPDWFKWYKWYILVIWLLFEGFVLFRVICC